MPLPDASRLSDLHVAEWTALGQRLRDIGVTYERAGVIAEVGASLPDAMRLPLQQWHVRRSGDAAGFAMRMFMFGDAVNHRQAEAAVGASALRRLIEIGFVIPRRGGLVSPFALNIVNDLYIVCDDLTHGGEAVMGAGPTTADLCQASYPSRPVDRFLDLGCGAGTAALLFSTHAAACVGVDVNPRAILLSRINAALNGIENVEFRQGDLYEPVRGEAFDLIASQPPFVAQPPGVPPATFLHGGPRGDELPVRVLGAVARHLRPRGRAVLLVEWPLVDDRPLQDRVREALGEADPNLLLLAFPETNLDDHCARYTATAHAALGETYRTEARRLRTHLDRLSVRGLRQTIVVVQERDGGPSWTATIDVLRGSTRLVTGQRLDKLIAGQNLLARSDETLLGATLRVVDGLVTFEQPFGDPAHQTIRLRPAPESLAHETQVNADTVQLLTLVHRSPNVRAGITAFEIARGLEPESARSGILSGVRGALVRGLLEPG